MNEMIEKYVDVIVLGLFYKKVVDIIYFWEFMFKKF